MNHNLKYSSVNEQMAFTKKLIDENAAYERTFDMLNDTIDIQKETIRTLQHQVSELRKTIVYANRPSKQSFWSKLKEVFL